METMDGRNGVLESQAEERRPYLNEADLQRVGERLKEELPPEAQFVLNLVLPRITKGIDERLATVVGRYEAAQERNLYDRVYTQTLAVLLGVSAPAAAAKGKDDMLSAVMQSKEFAGKLGELAVLARRDAVRRDFKPAEPVKSPA